MNNTTSIRYLLILLQVLQFFSLFAQKPTIDSTVYARWPTIGWGGTLSNDGRYFKYNIENMSTEKNMVFLQSTDGKWKKKISEGQFTADSKYFCYKQGEDSLAVLTLGTDHVNYFTGIPSFNLQPYEGGEWVCYFPRGQHSTFVLMDLKTLRKKSFENVVSHKFSDNGHILILIQKLNDNTGMFSVKWLNMDNGSSTEICAGQKTEVTVLDVKHQQLIYKQGNAFWYYKYGKAPVCISEKIAAALENGLSIKAIDHFSKDGNRVFLYCQGPPAPQPVPGAVEVWSYRDEKLQTESPEDGFGNYETVFDLTSQQLFRIQEKLIDQLYYPKGLNASDTLCLIKRQVRATEKWSTSYKVTNKLVNTINGRSTVLDFIDKESWPTFSTSGKYLIYFDNSKGDFFTFEIATGIVRNITKGIEANWIDLAWNDAPMLDRYPRPIAGWLKNDEAVLIYDQYDLWKVDPTGKQKPLNVTNGYGTKHKIIFHVGLDENADEVIDDNKPLLLNAFNLHTKENGYFSKKLDKSGDPEKLFMGPYVFDIKNPGYLPDAVGYNPIKAKEADVFLVRRMSATAFPNLYATKDFKIFTQITDLSPEKNYNWLTNELHTWKSLDGRMLQGILYKPENFDPSRKYPVIFHYYQQKSNGLYAYLNPEALDHGMNLNIPTYVSNGYLVFCPDIFYEKGDPMQGTYNAVISAANYLASFPFVDAKKMGIQGGSFGGFQTNYLVTHSGLFAAAMSSAGIADLVSGYGSLMDMGNSQQNFYESGQIRMGSSFWGNPSGYIKNSPIFQVDKVTTPLLIMQGKNDGICLYTNTIEFFTGLRRMGKKSWMLVYPNAGHGVDGKDRTDFSIRMRQFFDHYLCDKPAPVWMLEGIPPARRGIDDGLRLNPNGGTPGSGLLTPREQKIVEALMSQNPLTQK